MKEIWKKFPYEGFEEFEISNLGNVRKISYPKIWYNERGYYMISVLGKNMRVHRVVADAFIPNPDGLETVDHIDNDKNNNTVENLQWMSRIDNLKKGSKVD
jgi:hypothetical protein